MCKTRRLEGRILPRHSDPKTQEIPAFLIPRVTLPVQPSPVRLFSGPTNVFQMRGGGPPAATRNRNESTVLLGRSAFDYSLKGEAAIQTKKLVIHLSNLGFAINWKKSSPLPSQSVMYLGVELDSAVMRARLSQPRMETLWSPPPLFPGQRRDSPLS